MTDTGSEEQVTAGGEASSSSFAIVTVRGLTSASASLAGSVSATSNATSNTASLALSGTADSR